SERAHEFAPLLKPLQMPDSGWQPTSFQQPLPTQAPARAPGDILTVTISVDVPAGISVLVIPAFDKMFHDFLVNVKMRRNVQEPEWQEILPGGRAKLYAGAYFLKVVKAGTAVREPNNI